MASFQKPNYVAPVPRATAVALVRYVAVKASATEGLVEIAGAGEAITGFVMTAADASAPVEIAGKGGGAKAIAGGTISDGDDLKVDANGHLVVASTAGDRVVATARQDAVDNDVFAVFVTDSRIHA